MNQLQMLASLAPTTDHYVFQPQNKRLPRFAVSSIEDAAQKWCQARDAAINQGMAAGVSSIGNGGTVYGTINCRSMHKIATIAYNGRVTTA